MRFGVLLEASDPGVVTRAARAEALGFDLLWLEDGPASACVAAAALAPHVTSARVGVTVDVGDRHPIEVAEEAAVADLALGGRLALALRPSPGHEADLPEAVDLVLAAVAARPFRHPGPRWPTPTADPVRVTPAPAQLELPVWVAGATHADAARARGLAVLAGPYEQGADPGLARLPRPALRRLAVGADGAFGGEEVVRALRAERDSWGLDTVVLLLPDGLEDAAWERALAAVQAEVRPRVQLHSLPAGLEDHWAEDRR